MSRILYRLISALLCLLGLGALVGCTARGDLPQATRTTNDNGEVFYNNAKVLFEDDFDTLDTTKWKINPIDNLIRRAAYHSNDNVFCKDGNLVIRTDYKADGALGAGWYTGWIETSVKTRPQYQTENYQGFATTYGYYEIRAKVPWVPGAWFAFWMMPDEGVAFTDDDVQGTATDGCEIDIMETNWSENRTGHVIHYDGYSKDRLKSLNSGTKKVKNMHTEFHTYGFEWTKDSYTFFIDGKKTWRTSKPGVTSVNQYVLLTGEIGGHNQDGTTYPGVDENSNPNWMGNINTNSKDVPYDFVIDYIRVLEKRPF